MDIVHFTPQKLWDWLEDHGCKLYEPDEETVNQLLEENVVVYQAPSPMGTLAPLVPIQILKAYFPYQVCRICKSLEIPVPDRFLRHYLAMDELKNIHAKEEEEAQKKKVKQHKEKAETEKEQEHEGDE